MPKGSSARRLAQITQVLLRHGFALTFGRRFRPRGVAARQDLYPRLRQVLEDLGPTFVKFGQLLGNRVDLLPLGLVQELQKLQYRVSPFDAAQALRIAESEWGMPASEVIAHWDPVPTAAASVSQVHKARLRDGRTVAIKIQRPDAERVIREDLRLLCRLADFVKLFLRSDALDPSRIIKEFERAILSELDFRSEIRSLTRLRSILASEGRVRVPEPVPHLSTGKVLVTEWVDGVHPLSPADLKRLDVDPKDFLEELASSYLRQIFRYGFFHADPHPGNILVTPERKIYLVDAGHTGVLYKKQRDLLNELVIGLVTGDRILLVQNIWELCATVDESPPAHFEQELGRIVESFLEIPLKDINLIQLFTSVIDLFQHHGLEVPIQFYDLLKALITLDSLALRFHPEFQLVDWLSRNVVSLTLNPQNLRESLLEGLGSVFEAFKLLGSLPNDLRGVLRTLKKGKLQVTLDERNLSRSMTELGRITNRLSASLIITGFILAGTVLIQNPAQPMVFGIPILAAPLFGAAIVMGLWLLWSIWRSRTF